MTNKISPIFRPLYKEDTHKALEKFLSQSDFLKLSSTISYDEKSNSWSSTDELKDGLFSTKLVDVLDANKAYLSYGNLQAEGNLFSAKNILEHMRKAIHGLGDGPRSIDYNKIADELLEMLPEAAVSSLLGRREGTCLVEMPFVTPFPIQNGEGTFTPCRMGMIFEATVPSVSIVYRPLIDDNFQAQTITSSSMLGKKELEAIHRRYIGNEVSYFTVPSLAGPNVTGAKALTTASPMFAYCDSGFLHGNDRLHSQGLTIGGGGTGLRMALQRHKEFQSLFMKSILARGNEPWSDSNHMFRELSLLPEVCENVRRGTSPLVAMKNEITSNEDAKNRPYDANSRMSLHHEFKAMLDAGYGKIAKKAIPNHPFVENGKSFPELSM
ncbi:hypothetical protein YA0089_28415 [Pseudomonas viridiflava]|uniref:hypothetical protein n=1 Tax=Pseudomonas viridiflava TaxID=33069 RepID=UPI0018E5EFDA|nr:hypothetical protein [Pseudomonas viridiflava]MBI6727542.1 hypothetical protein [Pseudomonas viridiflava]